MYCQQPEQPRRNYCTAQTCMGIPLQQDSHMASTPPKPASGVCAASPAQGSEPHTRAKRTIVTQRTTNHNDSHKTLKVELLGSSVPAPPEDFGGKRERDAAHRLVQHGQRGCIGHAHAGWRSEYIAGDQRHMRHLQQVPVQARAAWRSGKTSRSALYADLSFLNQALRRLCKKAPCMRVSTVATQTNN